MISELKPIDGRKSFYGKAQMETYNRNTILKSYDTYVAMIDNAGNLKKLWNGYSVTTMRHINAFLSTCGLETMNKKQWENLPCTYYNPLIDMIIEYNNKYGRK